MRLGAASADSPSCEAPPLSIEFKLLTDTSVVLIDKGIEIAGAPEEAMKGELSVRLASPARRAPRADPVSLGTGEIAGRDIPHIIEPAVERIVSPACVREALRRLRVHGLGQLPRALPGTVMAGTARLLPEQIDLHRRLSDLHEVRVGACVERSRPSIEARISLDRCVAACSDRLFDLELELDRCRLITSDENEAERIRDPFPHWTISIPSLIWITSGSRRSMIELG